ncbi:hypothetical protein PVAP13_8NG123600 [Panicum virgatum]|uniref:Uncharacterized protein n=1 Tax=Panicum virgatum TaxID=38727 RepID=A0A8T0PBK4_PANVG|nr:hypothetical protein PVAP13_8NG123600 [Panicum virgatum]
MQRAYGQYLLKLETDNPAAYAKIKIRNDRKMLPRWNFWCHKQPENSVWCGYVVCEYLRANGRYTEEKVEKKQFGPPFGIKEVDNIRRHLCRFILREICHVEGAYYEHNGIWSQDPNLKVLFDWNTQKLVFGLSSHR